MSSGWFFRSQNGCGNKTAASAGDYPEEEEEAGEELRPEGQGGCQVKVKLLKNGKLQNISQVFTLSLHAKVARKAKRADIFKR